MKKLNLYSLCLKSAAVAMMLISAVSAYAQSEASDAGVPVIYGSMVENDSWSTWERYEGIYSFQPVADTEIVPVYTDGWDLNATAGGVLVDNIYHIFSYRGGGSSWFSVSYSAYNVEDWSVDYSSYFSEVIVSNDMTCDPTTDKVYCAQKADGKGKLILWDPVNIDNINEIAKLDVEIVAIAAKADGTLCGVGADGCFYLIDKTDGALTKVGDTGITPDGYQSAVIDYGTGIFYWAASTKGKKSALYSIDVNTADAVKICDFADNARFCGLYMLGGTANPGAPAAVTDLKVNFENGSNDGTVTFTMPSQTFGADALTGSLKYRLEADGIDVANGEADAGKPVTIDLSLTTGSHQLVLVTINEAGESPRTKCSVYVGKGVPGYVDRAKAELTEIPGEVCIYWEAPDYCVPQDAYFDEDALRYSVMRIPGDVVIADHIEDTVVYDNIDTDGPLSVYKYQIIAHIDELSSNAAITNGVAVGAPLTPPYEVSMATADLGLFTILDANNDGSSWVHDWYGYGVVCGDRWDGECDDWLILPPMHLESNGVYHTIITVGNDYDGPSAYEIKIGKTPTVEGMTQTVQPATSTTSSFDDFVRVSEAGTYYIGIHCIGAAGTAMYVTEILVHDEANFDAPDQPTIVKGVGAEKGELAANITFITPTKTLGGDPLNKLNAINIYRGEKLVCTLEDVEPGKEYTCKVEAVQEFNTYSVAAVNDSGEGVRARIDYVFAGYDFPATVTGFSFCIGDDGHPVLTWHATPEEGLYGYYVNPDDVVYEIYRGYGDGNYDLIEEAFKGTEYVDVDLDTETDQFLLQYYIYPVNSIGRGYGSSSNVENFGRPYQAPFTETFPGGSVSMYPWYYQTNNAGNAGWYIIRADETNLPDYDGSNGLAAFMSEGEGDEATIYSPFVSVKGMSDPILDFYYYCDENTADVTVTANGNVLANEAADKKAGEWCRFKASLSEFVQAKSVKFALTARNSGARAYSFIDNVRVREKVDHDLAIVMLNVPAEMTIGDECSVEVVVKNDGEQPSGRATVMLYRNGYTVGTVEIQSLKAAEKLTLDFPQMPDMSFGKSPTYKAEIVYAADQDESNNITAEKHSAIVMPRYPAPTDLTADAQGSEVTLTWTAPTETWLAPEPIVEDFESYESFAVEMEPWTVVDGDKQNTVVMSDPLTWYENLDYPHSGEPMAYQIFDVREAGIDYDTWIFYAPHSGDKVAICWSTDDWNTDNDDWLISPELFPGGQSISFWVYSRTGYWDSEKYEVLYSSTDTDVDSFKLLVSGIAVNEWTEVAVELPSDAKYFAIHTVSSMSNTETWYDDITYIPASLEPTTLDLLGFNVYRDNELLNSEPVIGTAYVDSSAPEGKHKYNVSAVYGVGESVLSDGAYAEVVSGISCAAAKSIKVIGAKGEIRIIGAEGSNVTVYSVNGLTLSDTHSVANDYRLPIPQGIYLVTVDSTPYKVIVH